MSFRYILLAHSDSCNIVVFSKLLDDHTIMAHFSFAQHRISRSTVLDIEISDLTLNSQHFQPLRVIRRQELDMSFYA